MNNQRDADHYNHDYTSDYNNLKRDFLVYDNECNSVFLRSNHHDPIARLQNLYVYIQNIIYYVNQTINSHMFQRLPNNTKEQLLLLYKRGHFTHYCDFISNKGPSYFRRGDTESSLANDVINKFRELKRLVNTLSSNNFTGFGQRYDYYY